MPFSSFRWGIFLEETILFDYRVSGNRPSAGQDIWDQHPLSALSGTILTPFSYSLVAEILRRGWFNYYSEAGFEPQPSARLVRQHQGRTYLNLSLSARLDAEEGITPLTLCLNSEPVPLAEKKSSLLSGILGNRAEKRVWNTIRELESRVPSIRHKARDWFETVSGLKWSQAEILQVMEQIERVGADSLMLYFAARHHLELGLNQILWALQEKTPFPQSLSYVNAFYSELSNTHLSNLVESDLTVAITDLAQLARNEGIQLDNRSNWADWSDTLPRGKFKTAIGEFLDHFGHRAAFESELRYLRWHEDPSMVFDAVLAMANRDSAASAYHGVSKSKDDLLQAIDSGQRQGVQEWLSRVPKLLRLQSQALDAFAYILAGSRRWIQAAAREAMTDERLSSLDDAFYFSLEELKEMMTGERNVSDREGIRAQLAERQSEFTRWQQSAPPPLLIGDQEVAATRHGLPTPSDIGLTVDSVTDFSDFDQSTLYERLITAHDTLKLPQLDGGLSALLPQATCFVLSHGHLLDPAIAAAWSGRRAVVGVD